MPNSNGLVIVFPVINSVLGLRGDWFELFSPRLIHPAYLLMALMIVIWIGVNALKGFEDINLEKKAWTIPITVTIVVLWPSIVIGIKDLIDTFNTFLVTDVFKIPWQGFGFPAIDSFSGAMGWPAEALVQLLPNLAYWILYAFFVVFFFFYAILGPFVLAKGILADEMETFFDLVRELAVLLLWQTTAVIFVCFLLPDIVSGQPLPAHPPTNFYFLSFVLGIMLLFVPTVTRKFARNIEGAIVPLGFRWGGAVLGISAVAKLGGGLMAGAGIESAEVGSIFKRLAKLDEFRTRLSHRTEIQELTTKRREMEKKLQDEREEEQAAKADADETVMDLFKRAKKEEEGEQ